MKSDQGRNQLGIIVVISFLMLFLEISLIRWLSTEIRIFAYVNNLVLLACFLGIGVGCYFSDRKPRLTLTLLGMAVLLIVIYLPAQYFGFTMEGQRLHLIKDLPTLLSAFTDSLIWFETSMSMVVLNIVVGILAVLAVFSVIVVAFIPLGQVLGGALNGSRNLILAYSVNIVASLAGIWCFNLLSFQSQPPWVWFAVVLVFALVLALQLRIRSLLFYGLLAVCAFMTFIMARESIANIRVVWSPYQKLEVSSDGKRGFGVSVNGVGFMAILNMTDDFLRNEAGIDPADRWLSQYDIPYVFHKEAKDVLIVGSGAGNDAAGALRNDAQHITAVEIDPGVYKIGKRLHPEKPYSNEKVNVVIDDARSFFRKAQGQFDLISFGLLDSHTLGGNFNNTRLDHYVYTEESFREARALLKEDGVMTVIFAVQREWMTAKLEGMIRKAFGEPPIAFFVKPPHPSLGLGGSMFVAGKNMAKLRKTVEENPALAKYVAKRQTVIEDEPVKLSTDNWPYLYLEGPKVPTLHLIISGILIILCMSIRKVIIPKGQRLNWHFFFLGSAFLLLEFQNISKTSLLFGSTWLVNSFIFSAILILILIANLVAAKFKNIKPAPLYICLLLSVIAVYCLPLSLFNSLSYVPRVLAASVLLNIPIFFAGIVFITSFRDTKSPNIAFGSNLLGAGVGGILESLSFITGVHALLILVALFYTASWVALRSRRS